MEIVYVVEKNENKQDSFSRDGCYAQCYANQSAFSCCNQNQA